MSSDSEETIGANILTLPDIISNISAYIVSVPAFRAVQTEVEVTEIKEYPNIIFLTVSDALRIVNMKAVIFKSDYQSKISPGDKIVVSGAVRLYKNEVQLVIKSYVGTGMGDSMCALTKLRAELSLEGYFDNKKDIGQNYQTIGVVSSLRAAGLKDFIHTIESRCSGKKLYIYPATVQGLAATTEIPRAIQLANTHANVKILVIIRGGGSKEDLECFNDKAIARAIKNSVLPVVTGIGHQIDTSIADLVADKHFITPTAVAQGITVPNLLTTDKISAEITFLKDLFMIKFNSYTDYVVSSEARLAKYKGAKMTKLQTDINSITQVGDLVKARIQNLLGANLTYVTKAAVTIEQIRTELVAKITRGLDTHATFANVLSLGLSNQLDTYANEIRTFGRPTITDKRSGKEISLRKDLKPGRRYRIAFIDGHYDIKISMS